MTVSGFEKLDNGDYMNSSLGATHFAVTPLSITEFDQPFLYSEVQFGISDKVRDAAVIFPCSGERATREVV